MRALAPEPPERGAARERPRSAPQALLAEHGPTALLYGALALLAVLHGGAERLALRRFDGRVVSEATLAGYDVEKRIGLYALAAGAFLLAGASALLVSRRLARSLSPEHLRVLRALSIAGLALMALRLFAFEPEASVGLAVGLHALTAGVGVLTRRLAREEWFGAPPAYVAWLAASAAALLFPLFQLGGASLPRADLAACAGVTGIGLSLHLAAIAVARRAARTPPRERIERWIHASLPLAVLALVPFLRDEGYLLLNGRGVFFLRPLAIQAFCCAAILLWIGLRRRSALSRSRAGAWSFDLERMLGRASFPLLLCGALAFVSYRTRLEPPSDLHEPANAALSIQQWFDFGRLPFAETFDVHGLWDSAYGFLYAFLGGEPRELFGFYDFGKVALARMLLYAFLFKGTGNPALALFATAFLPHANGIAPAYCAPALAATFALSRALRRGSVASWTALFLLCAFLALWRIDIGLAASAAVLGVVALERAFLRCARLLLGRAAAGAGLAAAATVAVWFAGCAAAGIDPIARTRDLFHLLLANQAFGHPKLASVENDVVLFHLLVVPIGVFLTGLAVVLSARSKSAPGESAEGSPRTFLVTALLFLCCYYFANVPRGLVRHTFVEPGNVYLASFSALFLGLFAWWRSLRTGAPAGFVAFVAVTSVVCLLFPLASPRSKVHAVSRNLWQELLAHWKARDVVQPEQRVLERDALPADYAARTFGELRAFLDANLAREETFLDLGNNPMLYVFTHRRSPHWLNHLMCAAEESAQGRVLEELARFEVPVVVLAQDPDEAKAAGVRWHGGELDGVPFRLRQFRLFEHVYERYRPLALLDRWRVWVRADWAMRAPPGEPGEPLLAWRSDEASAPPPAELRRTALEILRAGKSVREEREGVELAADRALLLCVKGSAPLAAPVRVDYRLSSPSGSTQRTRAFQLPAGTIAHALLLVVPAEPCMLEELRVDLGSKGALDVEAIELEARDEPAFIRLAQAERATQVTELGLLAWIWGRYDERRAERRAVQTLVAARPGERGVVEEELALQARSSASWRNGIHLELAAALLEEGPLAASLQVGDRLRFAESGEREIVGILGRQVMLAGETLDPAGDGAPSVAVWRRPSVLGDLVSAGERRAFDLPPPDEGRPIPYLVLRLANRSGSARSITVEHGDGGAVAGRFSFELRADRDEHEYCVRLSVHSSWWTRSGGWLALTPKGGAIELVEAFLAEGD